MGYSEQSEEASVSLPSYEDLRFKIFNKEIHIIQILGLLSIFVIWEIIPDITPIKPELMPSFSTIFTDALIGFSAFYGGSSLQDPVFQALFVLARHSAWTAFRFFVGVLSGLIFGFTLGLALSWHRIVRDVFEPVVTVARTVPLLALIPLFVLWFGTSELGKYIYVTYAITALFTVNTLEAVTNFSDKYIEFAASLGSSKTHTYRTIIIPGIIPELVGGTRVILGLGWAVVLAAEFIGGDKGLGDLLIKSQQLFFPGRIFIILIIFMVFTLIVNATFVIVARRLAAWQE